MPAREGESFRLIGEPRFGGILVVSDHAGRALPPQADPQVPLCWQDQHIAVDIGVAQVGQAMARRAGIAAFQAQASRLVCDLNRAEDDAIVLVSDGVELPGNRLDAAGREARLERWHRPYHAALAQWLDAVPPALIVSLHSFTPKLATCDQPRPWQVGILYNTDERAARMAIPLLEALGFCVGDQQPYSGRLLNYTMNRHAEAEGRPYLGVEIRQDLIAGPEGQAEWAEILADVCNKVALNLA